MKFQTDIINDIKFLNLPNYTIFRKRSNFGANPLCLNSLILKNWQVFISNNEFFVKGICDGKNVAEMVYYVKDCRTVFSADKSYKLEGEMMYSEDKMIYEKFRYGIDSDWEDFVCKYNVTKSVERCNETSDNTRDNTGVNFGDEVGDDAANIENELIDNMFSHKLKNEILSGSNQNNLLSNKSLSNQSLFVFDSDNKIFDLQDIAKSNDCENVKTCVETAAKASVQETVKCDTKNETRKSLNNQNATQFFDNHQVDFKLADVNANCVIIEDNEKTETLEIPKPKLFYKKKTSLKNNYDNFVKKRCPTKDAKITVADFINNNTIFSKQKNLERDQSVTVKEIKENVCNEQKAMKDSAVKDSAVKEQQAIDDKEIRENVNLVETGENKSLEQKDTVKKSTSEDSTKDISINLSCYNMPDFFKSSLNLSNDKIDLKTEFERYAKEQDLIGNNTPATEKPIRPKTLVEPSTENTHANTNDEALQKSDILHKNDEFKAKDKHQEEHDFVNAIGNCIADKLELPKDYSIKASTAQNEDNATNNEIDRSDHTLEKSETFNLSFFGLEAPKLEIQNNTPDVEGCVPNLLNLQENEINALISSSLCVAGSELFKELNHKTGVDAVQTDGANQDSDDNLRISDFNNDSTVSKEGIETSVSEYCNNMGTKELHKSGNEASNKASPTIDSSKCNTFADINEDVISTRANETNKVESFSEEENTKVILHAESGKENSICTANEDFDGEAVQICDTKETRNTKNNEKDVEITSNKEIHKIVGRLPKNDTISFKTPVIKTKNSSCQNKNSSKDKVDERLSNNNYLKTSLNHKPENLISERRRSEIPYGESEDTIKRRKSESAAINAKIIIEEANKAKTVCRSENLNIFEKLSGIYVDTRKNALVDDANEPKSISVNSATLKKIIVEKEIDGLQADDDNNAEVENDKSTKKRSEKNTESISKGSNEKESSGSKRNSLKKKRSSFAVPKNFKIKNTVTPPKKTSVSGRKITKPE